MNRIKSGVGVVAVLGVVLFGAKPSQSMERAAGEMAGGSEAVLPGADDAPSRPTQQQAVALNAASSTTLGNTGAKSTGTPALVDGSGRCAPGMVEVEGDYCPLLEQKCLRWLDPETKLRCAEFAPTTGCQGKTVHKHFCIDRFEYPNKVGEKPVVMKTWYDARDACQAQGKRLCGDSEWTLACEGQEHLPYPYGYARNAEACNIDKPHPDADEAAIANPATRDAEVARLWQGEPSGAREACVSPFGVHDMTGNVDEWVVNESGHPYKSGLKGGYWGPVRTRCRPMTTAHYEQFIFYQIGFRCCGESRDGAGSDDVAAPSNAGSGTEAPATIGGHGAAAVGSTHVAGS